MTKVSIIVPVYNTREFVKACVESVLVQTMTDWEMLLIDDGSTDGSSAICDELAQQDERIRVFHKPNGGVSSARNVGLEHARGEWLAFVDSDDEIDNSYLDISGADDDTDIIIKSFQTLTEDRTIQNQRIISKGEFLIGDDFFKFYIQKRKNALWDKLLRRRIVQDTRFFEDVRVGEDFLFVLSCLHRIHKCYISNKGCYYYFLRTGSAMRSLKSNSRERLAIILENIKRIKEITSELNVLGDCIILTSYLQYISKFLSIMTDEEKLYTKSTIRGISIKSMRYANFLQTVLSIFYYINIRIKFL